MAALRQRPADPAPPRAGSVLVECIVALAVAAAVFLPALAALRGALRADARTAARAEAAARVRPAVRAAASQMRLEPDDGTPRTAKLRADSASVELVALPSFRFGDAPAPESAAD